MKNMKKSMFISTVLLVVLLVVALSTATFAWFSSNNTVIATQTTMTAATSMDASIGIGWTVADATNGGYQISFDDGNTLYPTMPKIQPFAAAGQAVTAYYISTPNNIANPATFGAVAAGVNGALESRVVNIVGSDFTNALKLAEAQALVPAAAVYDKIFQTGRAFAMGINVVSAEPYPVASNTNMINGYPYLKVVDNGEAVAADEIEVDDVLGTYSKTAVDGDRIYDVKAAVSATYTNIAYGGADPSAFVLGAMSGQNYQYVLTDLFDEADATTGLIINGVTRKDMQISDAGAYTVAKNGEYLYCIRQAGAAASVRTTYSAMNVFNGALINGQGRFVANGTTGGIYAGTTLNELGANAGTSFYIRNNASGTGAAAISLSLKADFASGVGQELLRLAVFAKLPGATDLFYVGTLSNSAAETQYGLIAQGQLFTESNFYMSTAGTSGITIGSLAPGAVVELTIIAWFNGSTLTTAQSGAAAPFALTFTAA